jgi:hypothetical protein
MNFFLHYKVFTTHKQQRKKVALQNAHHSQIVKKSCIAKCSPFTNSEKKRKLHCEGMHTCVSFFVHSQNAQRKTKTHTTHDARIFGDDGIVSVIAEMRRKRKQGQ